MPNTDTYVHFMIQNYDFFEKKFLPTRINISKKEVSVSSQSFQTLTLGNTFLK